MNPDTCSCSCTKQWEGVECTQKKCGGKECKNSGTLDLNTCSCACKKEWEGAECEQKKCGGKVCQNRGTLDINTCKCACHERFSGEQCEIGTLLLGIERSSWHEPLPE